jgi:hypothetical protein
MNLSIWSLVVFSSYVMFYISMFFAVTFKATVPKISFMVVCWMLHNITIFWYGISTNQIGFILIAIFQFIMTVITIIISVGRSISENI